MNSLVRTAADKMKTISRDGAVTQREEPGERTCAAGAVAELGAGKK